MKFFILFFVYFSISSFAVPHKILPFDYIKNDISKNELKFDSSEVIRVRIVSGAPTVEDAVSQGGELGIKKFQNWNVIANGRSFDLVLNLKIDEYLKGVLPSEMPASWPIEALKAQAIVARSYARSVMNTSQDRHYDVDDTVTHQVFNLKNFSKLPGQLQAKISEAISQSKFLSLEKPDGGPYTTYYHADCGGQTDEPSLVWKTGVKYGVVKDEGCALRKNSNWSYKLSSNELNVLIEKMLDKRTDRKIVELSVAERSPSGRVTKIRCNTIGTDIRKLRDICSFSGEQLRREIGYSKIRSTMFNIKKIDDGYELTGRGYGHGVGLCQNGARIMALAGASASDIVGRYYPNAIHKILPKEHLDRKLMASSIADSRVKF